MVPLAGRMSHNRLRIAPRSRLIDRRVTARPPGPPSLRDIAQIGQLPGRTTILEEAFPL